MVLQCNKFEKDLDLFIDGRLSSNKEIAMRNHITVCDKCAELYAQRMAMISALQDIEQEELPEGFHEQLHLSLVNTAQEERVMKKGNNWIKVLGGVSAAVVLVVVGAFIGNGANRGYNVYDSVTAGDGGFYMATEDAIEEEAAYDYDMDMDEPMSAREYDEVAEEKGDFQNSIGDDSVDADYMDEAATATGSDVNPLEGRKIIYTASIDNETTTFDEDYNKLINLYKSSGGFMQSASIDGLPYTDPDGYGRTAYITVRIPAQQYGSFISSAKEIGKLRYINEYTTDITKMYFDTDIRVEALETQLERLFVILENSEDMDDVLSLEREIARVTTDRDQLKGQLRTWDDQVDYSTVTISLSEVRELTKIEPVDPTLGERIRIAYANSVNNMKRSSQNFVVWLVGVLPWLLFLLIIALIFLAIYIPVKRHRRNKK